MVLLTLLTHFDIVSVGTADGAEPAERLMFAMAPVGLRMRLSLRSPAACQVETEVGPGIGALRGSAGLGGSATASPDQQQRRVVLLRQGDGTARARTRPAR